MIPLMFMATCVGVWLFVHGLLSSDKRYDRARRMLATPKIIRRRCRTHVDELKQGQIALIDNARCDRCKK